MRLIKTQIRLNLTNKVNKLLTMMVIKKQISLNITNKVIKLLKISNKTKI